MIEESIDFNHEHLQVPNEISLKTRVGSADETSKRLLLKALSQSFREVDTLVREKCFSINGLHLKGSWFIQAN